MPPRLPDHWQNWFCPVMEATKPLLVLVSSVSVNEPCVPSVHEYDPLTLPSFPACVYVPVYEQTPLMPDASLRRAVNVFPLWLIAIGAITSFCALSDAGVHEVLRME